MKLVKIPFAKQILPKFAFSLIQGIGRTVRLKVIGEERINELKEKGESLLYAFWHGRQFLLVYYMQKRKISLLSSFSADGEIQARTLSLFGYDIVRGSSARGGAKGLFGLTKKVSAGYDIALAADGPTGPVYSVKDGVIFLAKKQSMWIVPLTSSSRPSHIVRSAWDRYLLPAPFSSGVVMFGEPYKPLAEIEEEKENLKRALDALTRDADSFVKKFDRI
jgi:hypothetical protein